MNLKKYYVTGMVGVTRVGVASNVKYKVSRSFDRVVYANDAVSARDMVIDSVKKKWMAGNQVYYVEDFEVVGLEVFESVIYEGGGKK